MVWTFDALDTWVFSSDYSSLFGSLVAPAGSQDQVPGARSEYPENPPPVSHSVRLRDLPQPAGVPSLKPEELWKQLRYSFVMRGRGDRYIFP